MRAFRFGMSALVLGSVLSAGFARAADASKLVGQWAATSGEVRLFMDFKENGQCNVAAAAGEKTQAFKATYKLSGASLVMTPEDSPPVTYNMKLDGDTLVLTGGDFGEGKGMIFKRRVGAVAPAPGPAPAPAAEDKPATPDKPATGGKGDGKLPGGTWDTKGLEKRFTILKTRQVQPEPQSPTATPPAPQVVWLLEVKEEGYGAFEVNFYDEDDVKIASTQVNFEPQLGSVTKGERTRGTVTLLRPEQMKNVVKVVVKQR